MVQIKNPQTLRMPFSLDNALKTNFFWLLHYVTKGAARQNRVETPTRVNRVWFDHIVVVTEYIGPVRGG